MALDESNENDTMVEEGGIKFLLDVQTADVLRQSGGLTIDFINESYRRGYMLRLGVASDCSSGGCSGCG